MNHFFDEAFRIGVEFGKSTPHTFENGLRGMVATDDIKEGELLAYVPSSYMITMEKLKDSPLINQMNELGTDYSFFSNQEELLPMAVFLLE